MQPIYGDREHRAARRALQAEAYRAMLIDLALMFATIGVLLIAGIVGGGP